jgi:SAM-dependent methyltransferase
MSSAWEEAVRWLRDNPAMADLVRDGYYDDPLLQAAERYRASPEWSELRDVLAGRTGSVLDVGAGRGITSHAFAKDGFRVTALEPDPSELVGAGAIRRLNLEAGVSIEVVETFSEHLPFEPESFDVVFARSVLHHTTDLERACREFHRVLRPGGLLVAIREHVISRQEDLPAFLKIHPLHHRYGGENAFLLSRYQSAISDAGFGLERTLKPFDSAVNYAPRTIADVRSEIGGRVFGAGSSLARIFAKALSLPIVWGLALRLLAKVDNRPGRLFSFVAVRVER